MTVAFVADATVVNGTAGTSVVVSRPTGTASGHVLVAFIAAVGNPSISTPAGWTLIGTQDASTSVRTAAFYRVADGSEPASWTWTLGAAQRNFGWVGAYSGVKTSAPIHASRGTPETVAGTAFGSTPAIDLTTGGMGVSAIAAVRTASGSATTWTGSGQNERADLSTNAGAGTDIAGRVQDSVYTGVPVGNYVPQWTASQSMDAGAMWAVTLQAEFIAYDGGALAPIVEAAFGADPDGDPDTWVWTDRTADAVDVGTPVVITTGRDSRGGIDEELASTRISFMLKDTAGKYMPDNPNSILYPDVVEGVPVRVRLPHGYVAPTTRATAFVERWAPSWDASGALVFNDVTASGRLQRVRERSRPIHSALHRRMLGLSSNGITPHAYYPCEDGSGATRVASAFGGHQPLQSSLASFASASDLAGSAPLPTLPENGVIGGALGPGYAATGQWCVMVAVKLPETPVAVESRIVAVRCTGTALDWGLWLVPGSPDSLNIRASAYGGTSLLNSGISIVEADHYGKWRLYSILVSQSGADVDWEAWSHGADSGIGNSGTLAGRTIGTARSVRMVAFAALAGMGVGHIALYTDPAFDQDDISIRAFAGLDGNSGDGPTGRFVGLCTEEGIEGGGDFPSGETQINMGPQPVGNLGDLLQEPADTDHGFMHDARPDGSLYLVRRWMVYNQTPTLTLDGNLGQIPASLRPTADGQSRITDSTVTREGGSSARYVAAVARGTRADARTLSLETDQHLYEIAGWRVALGDASLRYTQVPLNLRASPELAEAWMNCTIGSRVQGINLPASHGPMEIDGILVGWREEISADRWMVYMNLASARPYDVPVMESGDPETTWRLETGGSELAAAATSSATSLLVATTGDTLWTTDAGNYPLDLDVNGERVTASAIAHSIGDPFGRTVGAGGWGTPDSSYLGGAYMVTGTASEYSVTAGVGRMQLVNTNDLHFAHIDTGATDHEVLAGVIVPVVPTGAAFEQSLAVRLADTSNYYSVTLSIATTGVVSIQLFRRVATVGASVSSSRTLGLTHSAGDQWRIRLAIRGSDLMARAWKSTQPEPRAWQITGTDTNLTAGTSVAALARRNTGNTNGSQAADWPDFNVVNPQMATVTRGVAGGATAKAHAVGVPVGLWRARGVAL